MPLSVRTSSGTPNRARAWAKARHTARPVARATTSAITQNLEWSSTPVTTFASRSSPVVGSTSQIPPTMSMPHSCIGASRCQRTKLSRARFRGRDTSNPFRVRIRFTVRSDGTATSRPASAESWPSVSRAGLRSSSIRIRLAPQRGC